MKDQLKDNKKIIKKLQKQNKELNRSHQFIKSEIKRLYFNNENIDKKNGD